VKQQVSELAQQTIMSSSGKKRVDRPVEDAYDDLDRKPPAKKSNKATSTMTPTDGLQVDVFSVDLVETIFGYLDSRDLYQMSKVSKDLRGLIRHSHVVRSALMRGGRAQQTITRITRLVKDRRIFVPSALRLLRLCNGKRCEKCNENRVNWVNHHFGVFFCSKKNCLQSKNICKKTYVNKKLLPLVTHPRVSVGSTYSSFAILFVQSYTDGCGDRVGPKITKMMMDEIVQNTTTIEAALEGCDQLQGEDAENHAREIVVTFDTFQQETPKPLSKKA
jgi:hypothetical protein